MKPSTLPFAVFGEPQYCLPRERHLSSSVARPLLALLLILANWYGLETRHAWCATTDVYLAGKAYLGSGEIIDQATMVVEDGRIVAIGVRSEVTIPEGATIHNLGDVTLAPGLVLAETTIAERGSDEEEALTPFIRSIDGFDFFGEYDSLLAAGVTTVQLSPGSGRLMPGQGSVVKLAGKDPQKQTLNPSESLRILLTSEAFNPPRVYKPPVGAVSVDRPLEPTQPQLASNLGDAIAGLRALFGAYSLPEAEDDLVLASMREIFTAGNKLRVTARTVGEITAAHRIAEEFQLPYVLVGADEVVSAAESIPWQSDLIRGVILSGKQGAATLTNRPVPKPDDVPVSEPWERAAALLRQDIKNKIAITIADNSITDVWYLAGSFLAAGLEPQDVLSMVTSNPARMLSVDSRVGTLAPGKDADFIVLSGKPFGPSTRVLSTYVDGTRVYERAQAARAKVIRAASIYAGSGMLANGEIVVQDKVIRGLGNDVSFPSDAEIIEFPGAVIVPGFIDGATRVGTGADLTDRVGLNDRLGKWLASDDEQIAIARQGGITTGLLASTSLPSPVIAFKLGNQPRVLQDPVAIRFGITGNLTSEEAKLKTVLATAQKYVQTWTAYDQAFALYQKQLAEYEQAKAKYDTAVEEQKKKEEAEKQKAATEGTPGTAGGTPSGTPNSTPGGGPNPETPKPTDTPKPAEPPKPETTGTPPASDASKPEAAKTDAAQAPSGQTASGQSATPALVEPKKPEEPKKPATTEALEPYRLLFADKIVAIVEVNDSLALEVAIKVFVDEYKLRTVIAASGNAYRQAEILSGKKAAVVIAPPLDTIEEGRAINIAQQFLAAGVPLLIESRAGTGAQDLPTAVGFSVYRGLGSHDALAALTTIPAKQFSLTSIGTLDRGQDADMVVLSGQPFHAGTRVLAVMIDGEWVYQVDEEAKEGL